MCGIIFTHSIAWLQLFTISHFFFFFWKIIENNKKREKIIWRNAEKVQIENDHCCVRLFWSNEWGEIGWVTCRWMVSLMIFPSHFHLCDHSFNFIHILIGQTQFPVSIACVNVSNKQVDREIGLRRCARIHSLNSFMNLSLRLWNYRTHSVKLSFHFLIQ